MINVQTYYAWKRSFISSVEQDSITDNEITHVYTYITITSHLKETVFEKINWRKIRKKGSKPVYCIMIVLSEFRSQHPCRTRNICFYRFCYCCNRACQEDQGWPGSAWMGKNIVDWTFCSISSYMWNKGQLCINILLLSLHSSRLLHQVYYWSVNIPVFSLHSFRLLHQV